MPLVQSVNWASMARQAVRLLTRTKPRPPDPAHLVQVITRGLRTTFPQAFTPAHLLHGGSNSSMLARQAQRSVSRIGSQSSSPLRGLRTYRPVAPTTTGFGAARTFASGPAQTLGAKVPMGFRALASLLDDDNHNLPFATRYRPYCPRPNRKRAGKKTKRSGVSQSAESIMLSLKHLDRYHPRVTKAVVDKCPLPVMVESAITQGTTTTLSLPLAPEFFTLFEFDSPSKSLPAYHDTSVACRVLGGLFEGIIPLHELLGYHAANRVFPILARLDELAMFDADHQMRASCEMKAVCDQGRPEWINLEFKNRSIANVKRLLGDTLQGDWYSLVERKQSVIVQEAQLDPKELAQISEDWQEHKPADRSPLIMPRIDIHDSCSDLQSDRPFDEVVSAGPVPQDSASYLNDYDDWRLSEDQRSDADADLDSLDSFPSGLSSPGSYESSPNDSVLSLGSMPSDSSKWRVPPTQDDLDIESSVLSVEGSEAWSEQGEDQVFVVNEVESSWRGAGRGFGFAQDFNQ